MTIYTVFASPTNAGTVHITQATQANILAGVGAISAPGAIEYLYYALFASGCWGYEHFIDFDTSAIPDTVTSANLSVWSNVVGGTNTSGWMPQARLFDFGATISAASWRTPPQLAACPLIAHLPVGTGASGAYADFISDAAMITSINQAGHTRVVLVSDLYAAGAVAPTDNSYYQFSTAQQVGTDNDPKLVIVTAPAGGPAPLPPPTNQSTTLQTSVAIKNAQLDAIENTIGASANLLIFSGPMSIDCAAADPVGLVATIPLPADWMAAAASGSKAMLGTWSVLASVASPAVATSWRIKDANSQTCHLQGTISSTGGGGDMTIDNASISPGQVVTVTGFTIVAGNA